MIISKFINERKFEFVYFLSIPLQKPKVALGQQMMQALLRSDSAVTESTRVTVQFSPTREKLTGPGGKA